MDALSKWQPSRYMRWATMALLVVGLGGCFSQMVNHRTSVNSSLVDFLYPAQDKNASPDKPVAASAALPVLKPPLRVGLAFVPSAAGVGLPEADQVALLERVKKAFESEPYIREIAVIPNTYLRGKKGFGVLKQVGALYNVDVVALMSYDQVSNAADNKASVLYWTLVGAYFIKGSETAVNTFVDLAVFDLPTEKMLLRAAGTSVVENSSTLVNADTQYRKDKLSGFQSAVDDLNRNLAAELTKFREKMASANPPALKKP